MYITPVGFVLLPLSIWLLWQASKTARFNLNQIAMDKESRRLRRVSSFKGSKDNSELNLFLSESRKKIFKAGLFILASIITMFCIMFFTAKTPSSNKISSAWFVLAVVVVYYMYAIVVQFVIPLLDISQLELDSKSEGLGDYLDN